jgi:hypothetical protein
MIEVKVIADSISQNEKRITTLQLKYPRFIHAEFMTHRMFSRNASSSRAIPVAKMIEQVRTDPAMPVHWGKNQPGMQAYEQLSEPQLIRTKSLWVEAATAACDLAERMNAEGAHKQIVNRILEPFQWIHVVVTATEWDNFFALRIHPAAQPEIHDLAKQMKQAMDNSVPKLLLVGDWHLPYVDVNEIGDEILAAKISAARCARVSYLTHDNKTPSTKQDLELFNQLATRPYIDKRGNELKSDDPVHYSPLEHQAMPSIDPNSISGNFVGWEQFRKFQELTKF